MKKITLNIDALQVTTFVPAPEPGGARGTVRGHNTLLCETPACSNGENTCVCPYTQAYCSAGYSCDIDSCADTCANPDRMLC